jgi:hypothetical protein
VLHGGPPQRRGEQAEQRPRLEPRHAEHRENGCREQRDVESARSRVAESHREGALAVLDVGRDVAQVVGHEDRRRQRADPDGADHTEPGHGIRLRVERAERGHQTEEDEDVDLTEAAVAVGVVAAGVAPRREHRQGTERQHDPRLAEADEGQARHGRGGEAQHRGRLDVRRGGQALADEPHRADPGLVGAADAVGVVVRVVHPDLQREGDEEGEDRQRQVGAPEQVRGSGSEDDGGDGGGQGARAGTSHPLVQGCHGGVQRSLRKSGSSSGPRGRRCWGRPRGPLRGRPAMSQAAGPTTGRAG